MSYTELYFKMQFIGTKIALIIFLIIIIGYIIFGIYEYFKDRKEEKKWKKK